MYYYLLILRVLGWLTSGSIQHNKVSNYWCDVMWWGSLHLTLSCVNDAHNLRQMWAAAEHSRMSCWKRWEWSLYVANFWGVSGSEILLKYLDDLLTSKKIKMTLKLKIIWPKYDLERIGGALSVQMFACVSGNYALLFEDLLLCRNAKWPQNSLCVFHVYMNTLFKDHMRQR